MKNHTVTKTADSKGRVVLGKEFANATLIIETVTENEVHIRKAVVVPLDEAWLWDNPQAIASVRRGLEQAKNRMLSDGPDLAADDPLAEGDAAE